MNWKNTVSKLNTKHYSFPAGWDTRETIAEQLECSTDRVDTLLGPGLKSGEIEKQQFPVWDGRLNRKTLVWGYRVSPPRGGSGQNSPDAAGEYAEAIRATAARHPGKTPGQIVNRLPRSIRNQVNTAMVRDVLSLI